MESKRKKKKQRNADKTIARFLFKLISVRIITRVLSFPAMTRKKKIMRSVHWYRRHEMCSCDSSSALLRSYPVTWSQRTMNKISLRFPDKIHSNRRTSSHHLFKKNLKQFSIHNSSSKGRSVSGVRLCPTLMQSQTRARPTLFLCSAEINI